MLAMVIPSSLKGATLHRSTRKHPATTCSSVNLLLIQRLDLGITGSINGSTTTGAALLSPTAPFSQSTMPSKSLLSREESSSGDPNSHMGDLGNGSGLALSLSARTQKALHAVIRRIFERCFQEGAYHQVVGIAIEARSLEILREAITHASDHSSSSAKSKARDASTRNDELMDYLLDICLNVVQERVLRNEVKETAPLYLSLIHI